MRRKIHTASILLATVFIVVIAGCVSNQPSKNSKLVAEAGNVYTCNYTPGPIIIDGVLDEPAWEKAESLNFFTPETHEKPVSETKAKILWDNDYLYVAFKAYDKDIWGYFKDRDSITSREDVLEVFIKPDLASDPYYNFEINPINTIYDAFNVKIGAGGADHHRWSRWNCEGFKSAITIKGSLNNWADVDEYWQMEVAIPFSELPSLKDNIPQSGDAWMFHLARYDQSVYQPEGVETSSCALLSKPKFHRPEEWRELIFAK